MSAQPVFERGTSTLQRWSPALYENNARFVGDLAAPVVELLAPRAGERILDIGCGDGYLTEKIQASGASVTGVDYSPELVAAAQSRGLDVHLGNAEALNFQEEFHGRRGSPPGNPDRCRRLTWPMPIPTGRRSWY